MKSLKELYKIGHGPSSSHTMGPVNACNLIKNEFSNANIFKVRLCGSLASTGKGHLTDKAIIDALYPYKTEVEFDFSYNDLSHPNTMFISAYENNKLLTCWKVCSIGGGAITIDGKPNYEPEEIYPHNSFNEILEFCKNNNIKLWQYVEIFEGANIWDYLSIIWHQMLECVSDGLKVDGILDGGINTVRKAKTLYEQYTLNENSEINENRIVCAYAFAASEQNASGGLIVTAPTCGSSGVLPAVFKYLYEKNSYNEEDILKALATAGIIGNLIKTNASISGAECGCQAEVGSACSMASAGIAQLYNMDLSQIEYAAEIALEHHLGLTCDPICGLVQIPCIERNAVAALRALNEVTLATFLSDTRKISFDTVVKTMYETGKDLGKGYRETSEAGLAKIFYKR